MAKSNWVMTDAGWRHRPWWKVVINTTLRKLQRGRQYQWLIATKAIDPELDAGDPTAIGYCLAKIEVSNAP